jgi:hypothetical protein
MNNSAPFGRRGDGSFYINLDWTPETSPPTPTPAPPRRMSRPRPPAPARQEEMQVRLSRSIQEGLSRPRPLRYVPPEERPVRFARYIHGRMALRIECPGRMCPI